MAVAAFIAGIAAQPMGSQRSLVSDRQQTREDERMALGSSELVVNKIKEKRELH